MSELERYEIEELNRNIVLLRNAKKSRVSKTFFNTYTVEQAYKVRKILQKMNFKVKLIARANMQLRKASHQEVRDKEILEHPEFELKPQLTERQLAYMSQCSCNLPYAQYISVYIYDAEIS